MNKHISRQPHYYIPAPSYWPIIGSFALLITFAGFVLLLHQAESGPYIMAAGILVLVYMLFGWFGTVIRESRQGLFNEQVDLSFRWGMCWFIFSEVMFFAAFFGALFYARFFAVPGLAETPMLWPGYSDTWPTAGPGLKDQFTPMAAWGIPAVNTLILLSSGATVTWAHWGLKKNNRSQLNLGLLLTIVLGLVFLALQVYEYFIADFSLKTGIYGATFFMLTGFHGAHVTLGAIMLSVILVRTLAGHFTPTSHFGFEAVTWYWHFVDVVWLILFVFVYWL
ncbi:cytochrome c oxidase subunit III [Methylophilaceae bacterium]|nr:cytochrome c oxidase subunit III [Methylophilaceae bacterium]